LIELLEKYRIDDWKFHEGKSLFANQPPQQASAAPQTLITPTPLPSAAAAPVGCSSMIEPAPA